MEPLHVNENDGAAVENDRAAVENDGAESDGGAAAGPKVMARVGLAKTTSG